MIDFIPEAHTLLIVVVGVVIGRPGKDRGKKLALYLSHTGLKSQLP